VGVLAVSALFQTLEHLARLDLKLAAWVLREPARNLKFTSPNAPWRVGLRGFCGEIRATGILSLLAYFLLIQFPIAVSFFLIAMLCCIVPVTFISTPVLFLFGVPSLCLRTIGNATEDSWAPFLPVSLVSADPCEGLPVDTFARSLYPVPDGLIILPLLAILMTWLSLARARMVKRVLAIEDEPIEILAR